MAPQLVETFPKDKRFLPTYCAGAIYILTLLLDGYKFNEHTWSSIRFSQQVNTPQGQEQAGSGGPILALAPSSPWPQDAFRSHIPRIPHARDASPSHDCCPVIPAELHSYLPPDL